MDLRLGGRRIGRIGRIGWIGAVSIVLGLAVAVAWTLAWHWHPSDRYAFQGVDVSEAQGTVDWWSVRHGGADFAYLRATYGAGGRDTRFAGNWADVDASGLRRGALHVYSMCQRAADQANNFNTTVPRTPDALPAAVSVAFAADCPARPPRAVVLDEVRRYVAMVEAHTGKPVLLKVARDVDAAYRVTAGVRRPVWAVQAFFPPAYAARPWRMWQASDMRRIDGVAGPVHWNVVAP